METGPRHAPTRKSDPLADLREAIHHAAHLLPAQGPITAFVHHNTLHAFEALPFGEALQQGADIFGCETYLPEADYRTFLEDERITPADLGEVLLDDLSDQADHLVGRLGTRFHLRLAMLQYPLRMASRHELRWLIAKTDALRHFRPEAPADIRRRMVEQTRHWIMRDLRNGSSASAENHAPRGDEQIRQTVARLLDRSGGKSIEDWDPDQWEAFSLQLLWQVCQEGVRGLPPAPPPTPRALRHRDRLLRLTSQDCDQYVHEFLIRFCAAYLDQGLANWSLPHRELGFYRSFVELYRQPAGPPDRWLKGLRGELQRLSDNQVGPLESIAESMELLGLSPARQERYIQASLLALRGWAGMIWQTETRGDRVFHPAPEGSLVGFLAVRLILDRFAAAYVARTTLGFRGPLSELLDTVGSNDGEESFHSVEQRAFQVFQLAQVREWMPQELNHLSPSEWSQLIEEIEQFSEFERRRIYQQAFERRYEVGLLDALATHAPRLRHEVDVPKFQMCCCIDDREESFRRHLEEIEPACRTYGLAGFFGVAMYYRGTDDAYDLPLCPVIVKPRHYVREEVTYSYGEMHRRREGTRRVWGAASHRWHLGSRSFFAGIVTALLGAAASIPMTARILFPRATSQVRRMFGRIVQPPLATQLMLERHFPEPGPEPGQVGFLVEEMAGIVERALRDIGLTEGFSRLVMICGHGSSSLNNPHESAYNCGACAGARGGPNARAFARMANDPRVRQALSANGLTIPWTTVFLGAFHDTCNDRLTYFDLDALPSSHWEDFEHAKDCIDQARERNAHERCRRFQSARLTLTPEQALRHVESRAENLAEVRPEYNHATNAVTIVGRRSKTRGLFLDRRAFLASYDPTVDDDQQTILTRILQAVVPVCSGISLEYYFSCVDPDGWGCGSKLPHNITSLLGVMMGAGSDLRPGLSRQMVEIHEPLRPVFVIETTPAAMLRIMDRNGGIGRLCRNEWVRIVTLDPDTSALHVLRNGVFEPYRPESRELPIVKSSVDWYRGWRDHLGFAAISRPKSPLLTIHRHIESRSEEGVE
ncbi:MAG: DUF2309 domain-containing protein [Planctomycetaceae bacterium]|nr:DUF2309 domain-containing protein [Planctomycetaceae bacterium]